MSGLSAGIFLLAAFFGNGSEIKRAKADSADHLVINEIGIDSISGSGGSEDDWVELYNPTDGAISLNGWSIQKISNSGGTFSKLNLSGSIPAHGYFLIVRNQSSSTASFIPPADVSGSMSLANGNSIFLVNDDERISSSTNPYVDENIIDSVGFGSADFYEGSSTASSIPDAKSLARIPDGEDTDENSADFKIQDNPTPRNSSWSPFDNLGGKVLITITPDEEPVQNITSTGAEIIFKVNADGFARTNYGLTDVYGSFTDLEAVEANTEKTIILSGLTCSTTYHYEIYAENSDGNETDQTADAFFTTLPCGITIDYLTMTKISAKANDQYSDGWEWEYGITVWDLNETSLKMKFNEWSGTGPLSAAGNMQYSVDEENWVDINADNAYPVSGINISGVDKETRSGRQVKIFVKMKVPVGTAAGYYNSNYGILVE